MDNGTAKKDSKKNTMNIVLKVFSRCMQMIFSFNKFYVFFAVILTIIQGIIPVISLVIMQDILNGLQESSMYVNQLFFLVFLYVIFEIINSVLNTYNTYLTSKVSFNFAKMLTVKLLDKASGLELKDYENSEIYNIINRAQSEGNEKIITFFNSFFSILRHLVTAVSYVAVLISFKVWIIGIVLIMPIIKYFYSLHVSKIQFEVQKARTTKVRKAWYITYLITTGNAFKEIKLFNLKDNFIKQYKRLTDEIIKQDLSILKGFSINSLFIEILDEFISGGIFLYIVYNGVIKAIKIGDVVSYTRCIFNIQSSIQSILSLFSIISRDSLFVSLYFDFLDMKINKLEMYNSKDLIYLNRIECIELKDVSYRFVGSKQYVLRHINLKINSGETVALVGKNGSGKTTLGKIILGFYDDYEGDIFINGINLRDINVDSLRARMGCIFQDYVKYEASVRDNISYGDLAQHDNDEKLIKTLEMSSFDYKLIDERGLETMLGFWFDHGKQISLGEWQRIAIARAFIRDADFYVLDEPDASLDPESEAEILQQYSGVLEGKMGIFITHHLSNIKFLARKIVVLDKGKIIEQGTHDSLINIGKIYYRLYEKQNGLIKAKRSNERKKSCIKL